MLPHHLCIISKRYFRLLSQPSLPQGTRRMVEFNNILYLTHHVCKATNNRN